MLSAGAPLAGRAPLFEPRKWGRIFSFLKATPSIRVLQPKNRSRIEFRLAHILGWADDLSHRDHMG